MTFEIRKAKRSATKLRALLTGPSGSGKTWGALEIAKGIGGRTIVIDTEEGSSDLYDELHDFDVIDLRPPFSPERYIGAIEAAEAAGAAVIVIDSVTHCWSGSGGCLEILEDVAKAQFRGNTWSAFSVITPRWRAFVDRILRSKAHVIATGRSKTDTAQEEQNGRKVVKRLGMKLEARDGLEYEFTLVLDIIHDGHYAVASKDRTNLFSGDPQPITAATGKALAAWLAGGQARPAATEVPQTREKPTFVAVAGDEAAEAEARKDAGRTFARAVIAIGRASTRAQAESIRSTIGERLEAGLLTNPEAESLLRQLEERESVILAQEAADATA